MPSIFGANEFSRARIKYKVAHKDSPPPPMHFDITILFRINIFSYYLNIHTYTNSTSLYLYGYNRITKVALICSSTNYKFYIVCYFA